MIIDSKALVDKGYRLINGPCKFENKTVVSINRGEN